MPDCEPKIVLKPLPRVGHGVGVLIQSEQSAFRSELGQNSRAMPPTSVRAIHVAAISCYRQTSQCLRGKHGLMITHGRTPARYNDRSSSL